MQCEISRSSNDVKSKHCGFSGNIILFALQRRGIYRNLPRSKTLITRPLCKSTPCCRHCLPQLHNNQQYPLNTCFEKIFYINQLMIYTITDNNTYIDIQGPSFILHENFHSTMTEI